MRKCGSSRVLPCYDVEVHTKGILRVSGRRWVDLLVRVELEQEGEVDREINIYRTVVEDMKKYFSEKYMNRSKFLPIPRYVEVTGSNHSRSFFILETMRHLGYKKDILKNPEGLNDEHSLLVVANLAKFHAASYCFRKEKKIDFRDYSVLNHALSVPIIRKETIQILERILKTFPASASQSHKNFLDQSKLENLDKNLEYFGVLCHGHLCRENLLFRYKSNLESHLCCTDVILQDLSSSYYGSCVLDLLQFIFSSIDNIFRPRSVVKIMSSVYYDSFIKTVSSINSGIPVFNYNDFLKEIGNCIFYGFHFAVDIHTFLYKEALDNYKDEGEISEHKYVRQVEALIRHIVQFRIEMEDNDF